MTNIIKLKFLRDGQPGGRDYTYFTPVPVAVDDFVEVEGKQGVSQGVVTAVDVPEEEIAPFRDRAKTIIGKAKKEKAAEPVKKFDVVKAAAAQAAYCNEKGYPHFAPESGRCWRCNRNIYEQVGWKVDNGRWVQVSLDSPELKLTTGIDVERAGKELVTGCPHCHRSYCD